MTHLLIQLHRTRGLAILCIVSTVLADQYTKYLGRQYLIPNETFFFLNGIVQITVIENRGGFLGVVNNLPENIHFFLLYICVAILLLCCIFYLFFSNSQSLKYALPLSCVIGGGMGNLIDRILNNGGVYDFVSIGLGSFRTGIFNLADVFILTGSFLLGYCMLHRDY